MNYVEEKAQAIIDDMTKHNELTTSVATCDHYNWDREYHRMFPQIADKLRQNGYTVSSKVNFGVTDWTIAKRFD